MIRKGVADRERAISSQFNVPLTDTSQQCIQQQSILLGRFENSVNRLGYTSAQKRQCEEEKKSLVEESCQLEDKLETLESQSKTSCTEASVKEISVTKGKISTCKTEIGNCEQRMEELNYIIEEESMQAKRGRNIIRIGTKRLFDQVVQRSQLEIMSKEKESKEALEIRDQEVAITKERLEEANVKIAELKHELLKKEQQIKEMELKYAQLKSQLYPLKLLVCPLSMLAYFLLTNQAQVPLL